MNSRLQCTIALAAALLALAVGAPAASAETPSRIISGSVVPAGGWPSMGKVQAFTTTAVYSCGGTVIAPRWVITAAHCTFDVSDDAFTAGQFQVTTGRLKLSNTAAGEVLAVDEVLRHPNYSAATKRFDVALLHLSSPTSAPPMEIATPANAGEYSAAPEGVANVAGWGHTSTDGVGSDDLLQAHLPLRGNDFCARLLPASSFDPVTMVCAGRAGQSTCQGDSGGPLIVFAGTRPVLWGITSFGPRQCGSNANFFARVAGFPGFLAPAVADVAPAPEEPAPAPAPDPGPGSGSGPGPGPPPLGPPPAPAPSTVPAPAVVPPAALLSTPSNTATGDTTGPRLSGVRVPAAIGLRGNFPSRRIVLRMRSDEPATIRILLLRRSGSGLQMLRRDLRLTVRAGATRIALPRTTWSLRPGSYVLRIEATDAAGNSRTYAETVRVRP